MTATRFFQAKRTLTVGEIAELTGGTVSRDASNGATFAAVAPLANATSSDITACYDRKIKDELKSATAGVCLITKDKAELLPPSVSTIVSDDPHKAFALVLHALFMDTKPEAFISDKAVISPLAKLGTGVRIEAGAVIGNNAEIGDFCHIYPNAVIGEKVIVGDYSIVGACASLYYCTIGSHTKIYSGVRIGEDGFGFVSGSHGHLKIPQLGSVKIGDYVEIGANTCIDRGALSDTEIGSGTIIDNLVQVGHNNKIGKTCVLVSQVGVAGSCTFGDFVAAGGQAGFKDHLTIGTGSQVAAQSGVISDLEPMSKVMGTPAMPIKQFFRQVTYLKNLILKKE